MQINEIAKRLENRQPGTFFTVKMRRPAKVRKGVTDQIEKESEAYAQLCDYAARKPVREAVEAGERDAPELPSHIAEVFRIGAVRFWRGHNGKVYLPCVVNGGPTAKATWLRNGEPVDKAEIEPMLLASETAKRTEPKEGQAAFFGVSIENILEII